MMFSRTSNTLRRGLQRSTPTIQAQATRKMAGGHYMKISEQHTWWGEAFGTLTWLWIFHRARLDGPVVLGWRHPWEHAPDPFAAHDDHHDDHVAPDAGETWDKFSLKAIRMTDDDDDDEEDEEEDE